MNGAVFAWRRAAVNGRMALRHVVASTLPRCGQGTQDAPRAGARRYRARCAGCGERERRSCRPRRRTDVGAVLDLAERFWRGEVRGPELVRATGTVEEIAPGLLFIHAFANVCALRTDSGLVLVDTGNYR